MSGQAPRQLAAHAVICLAVCAGGYMALVDSARKQLATERSAEREPARLLQLGESLQGNTAAMTANLERLRKEEARMVELGKPARDERNLFASMMSLAAECGVRIDELNPTKLSAAPGPATPGQPAAAPAAPGDVAVGYSITATASYDQVAEFVRAVRTELGYSTVRSVRVLPVLDEKVKLVKAVIETEHYSFDPNPPLPADSAVRTAAAGGQ